MSDLASIRFEPDGKEAVVEVGTPLLRAAAMAGIGIETPCGGFGICGKCKVQIPNPKSQIPSQYIAPEETRHLTPDEIACGVRLACRQRVFGDCAIFVPETSRSLIAQILTGGVHRQVCLKPAVQKRFVSLRPPSVEHQVADDQRLLNALQHSEGTSRRLRLNWQVAKELPTTLRQANFTVTVTFRDHEVIAAEAGDTTNQLYGIAFDVGTTTLVGYLLDLNTGTELATASRLNPQVRFGDDLMSRLCHALSGSPSTGSGRSAARKELQVAVVKALNEIIAEVTQVSGIEPSKIYDAVVVGNTAMLHLLLGVDPSPLAMAPFVPAFAEPMHVEARRLGLRLHPNALVSTLPCVAGFVGADCIAVILTHLADPHGETAMAVDIGTNGEIVLREGGRYLACSAAAGPAFEGARISFGMRAATGAIYGFQRNGDLKALTVGGERARGICGSGLIDAVAALLDAKVIEPSGKLGNWESGKVGNWEIGKLGKWEIGKLGKWEIGKLGKRLTWDGNGQRVFELVSAEQSEFGVPILLTQRDVRELQLAKGSIRAAMNTLLKEAGVSWRKVERLYLAGAFGTYVSKESAVRIGLLPPLPLERIESVGNAAGVGAKLALLSVDERARAVELARLVEHVELSVNEHYHDELMNTIPFPEE